MQGLEIVIRPRTISLRPRRNQEAEIGDDLGELLDGAADVSGLAADQPGRQPRHRERHGAGEKEGEKKPEPGQGSRDSGGKRRATQTSQATITTTGSGCPAA